MRIRSIVQRLSRPNCRRWAVAGALTVAAGLLLTAAGIAANDPTPDRLTGWRVKLGNGDITSFATLKPTGASGSTSVHGQGAKGSWRHLKVTSS